ncbi:MAG: tyrosine-type recombinase/integrase [Thiobacillus sp.]|nr:tyrosine-type recombinase/integrase [Thiobacillus sp.]
MPRLVREVNLSSREARKRLAVRRKPYYRTLDEGLHLGYRQSHSGSAWVIRWYKGGGGYAVENLDGRPDDVLTADGATVLNWNQAQSLARKVFEQKQRQAQDLEDVPTGPYTVENAMTDYMSAYRRRGGKSESQTQAAINAFILPELGNIVLNKLTSRRIETWHEQLTEKAPRLRTKPGEDQRYRDLDNSAEGIRRRKSTANRVLTVLKAALNYAHQKRKALSDESWRMVKPFKEVDAARVRYLNDSQARNLVKKTPQEFKPLVQAALLTGCRYGELTALVASDYNAQAGTIHIRVSKSGKARHVALTEEGKSFFKSAVKKKADDQFIFTKRDGSRWDKSHQHRPFRLACEKAKLGAFTFHELRHTYASRLAMQGVPLAVIAAQLGHSDTRMVEKHYGHMDASYVARTVRAAFSEIGIVSRRSPTREAA